MNPFDTDYLPDEAIFELLDCDDNDTFWHDVDECNSERKRSDPSITERHEKIKSLQKRKAKKYNIQKPSKVERVSWLYAESPNDYEGPTDHSGKWLIFEKPDAIDAAWSQIVYGIENDLLGGEAKVSTKRSFNGDSHVICIYTYNWRDEGDVMRIRYALRELGFEKPLSYKTDADTLKKKYSKTGHKGISKYYE